MRHGSSVAWRRARGGGGMDGHRAGHEVEAQGGFDAGHPGRGEIVAGRAQVVGRGFGHEGGAGGFVAEGGDGGGPAVGHVAQGRTVQAVEGEGEGVEGARGVRRGDVHEVVGREQAERRGGVAVVRVVAAEQGRTGRVRGGAGERGEADGHDGGGASEGPAETTGGASVGCGAPRWERIAMWTSSITKPKIIAAYTADFET